MVDEFHHRAWVQQATAFRAAAVRAGPDAAVPSCPGWDVRKLVRHVGRVYAMVLLALELEPGGQRPRPSAPPEGFDAALNWFDDRLAELATALSAADSSRPVWGFFPGATAGSWTRRMAHETAVHRLDAALASGSGHELIFDPELAADGVDEMLRVMAPLGDWSQRSAQGRVLYHAADAGRAWLVRFEPGAAPEVGEPEGPALAGSEVDTIVAGTAETLYRRVWGRSSTAVVTGDAALADVVAGR